MFEFCFNDCIPKNGKEDELVKRLSETLIHYDALKKQYSTSVNGIITDCLPSKLILNNSHFTLANCIQFLNRELKKIALSNFTKYPVDGFFSLSDVDSLIEKNYSIIVNETALDAFNAKIVEENGGVLFTLSIHEELARHKLEIVDNEKKTYQVFNLYGEENNTRYISKIINNDIISRVGGFEKLIAIVGECSYSERFKKDFENLTSEIQIFLLKEIQYSINRKAITRFYPDDKLIKDVTPPRENEIKLFELRIYSPVATRVYFYETTRKIYFGSIEGKPKKKVQDSDILNAISIIKELILFK